ncbi:interferon gamma-like [Scomber japonicus]|uniref:interferon gamma-like n=1 Tax=Scomber japonicus TaxID=13676 RepID=UPI0023053B61|nr:interferon gamma-like [Scomber japonicus]
MVNTARAVVCLTLWLAVCQVRGSYIPPEMNKTIQNLLQHYKISNAQRFNGQPVFSKDPLNGKMETKMVFMRAVLDTYEKLIERMKKQVSNPHIAATQEHSASSVAPAVPTVAPGTDSNANAGAMAKESGLKKELGFLLTKITQLKRTYKEEEKFLHSLKKLGDIKMDDMVVQSKALWELPWLYEEASTLVEVNQRRRRRRRQARKFKTRPQLH